MNKEEIEEKFVEKAPKNAVKMSRNKNMKDAVHNLYRRIRREAYFLRLSKIHKDQLEIARKKEKIKVAFLLLNEAIWKYHRLYFLLKNDARFQPVVFVCPFIRYGDDIMKQEMETAYKKFNQKGYDVVKTINSEGEFLDIKKEFDPELVFFCTPWKHTLQDYTISNFSDRLTCYTHYGYSNGNLYHSDYNLRTQNHVWKFFLESDYHQELAKKHSARKGKNTVVTGYPGTDDFLDSEYEPKNPWKPQNCKKKRVIWAPHHTIPGNISEKNYLNYSTFLTHAELMQNIAKTYQDQIQFAFKPHPNLKGKLNEHWGEEKTETYYNTWKNMPNCQLEEGDYVDLFLTSDAMIHDCSSFLPEYLFVSRPVLYLVDRDDFSEEYNDLGKKALNVIPLGKTEKDIYEFIENTILNGNDTYKEKRSRFFEDYLRPAGTGFASDNIYHHLLKELKWSRQCIKKKAII